MTSGTSYSPPPAFGRFRLLHQIGAGVLGPVFRTHDPDDDRLVAVKVFTLDLTPEQAAQLAEEFQRLIAVELPSGRLAAAIDAGVEESVPYLALQYVAGESLDAAIRQYGPAPAPDAARLISHVADALDECARVGVFHGALHPRDILVTPGETHLTGMGVAMALERVGARAPVRRPYASPERETIGTWGAAADVFSLGAIAHEVLTGSRALPGTEEPLPGLHDLKVYDPAALREALEAALDPDPERRPVTAADFAAACAAALGLSGGAVPAGGVRPRKRARAKVSPRLPGLDDPLAVSLAEPVAEPERGAVPEAAMAPEPVIVPEPEVLPGIELAAEPLVVPAPEPAPVSDPPASRPERGRRARKTPAPVPVPPVELEPVVVPEPIVVPEPVVLPEPIVLSEPVVEALPETLLSDVPAAVEEPAPAVPELAATGERDVERDEVVAAIPEPPAPAVRPDADLFGLSITPAGVVAPKSDYSPELQALADDLERFEPPAEAPRAPDELAIPSGPQRLDTADLSADARVEPARRSPRVSDLPRRAPELAVDDFRDPGSLLAEPPVPRALDPGPTPRPTSFSRRVEPYRPVSPQSRQLVWPVAAGVVAGLLVGALFGYWWGSRATPAAPSSRAATEAAAKPGGVATLPVEPPLRTSTTPAPVASPAVPPARAGSGSPSTPGSPVSPRPSQPPAGAPAGAPRTPAAEAEPARPRATPIRTGTVRVRTVPAQADVFVDGVRRGVTPRNVASVPFGTHTIRVTRPGYQPQERTVTIGEGTADVRVNFTLKRAGRKAPSPAPPASAPSPAAGAATPASPAVTTGSIAIETRPPGARVRVDNRDVGVTPIVVGDLKAGTHAIRLELSGYRPWVTTVTVKAGARVRIAASLEAVPERSATR